MSIPILDRGLRGAAPVEASERLAALAMYDLPELAEANDRLWSGIAERLWAAGIEDAPARLTRGRSLEEVWSAPGLLLAQACGYPYMTALRERTVLVATPRYDAPGCEGPFHCSAIVTRKAHPALGVADLRGARLALNSPSSGTGMNLLRAAVARHAGRRPFFGSVTVTGSHAASAEAVAAEAADVAAIDAVTWAHLGALRPRLTRSLRVVGWTPRTPGLPLITARTNEALRSSLLHALQEVACDPALAGVRKTLRLRGFNALPQAHYSAVLAHEQLAVDLGYPVLR